MREKKISEWLLKPLEPGEIFVLRENGRLLTLRSSCQTIRQFSLAKEILQVISDYECLGISGKLYDCTEAFQLVFDNPPMVLTIIQGPPPIVLRTRKIPKKYQNKLTQILENLGYLPTRMIKCSDSHPYTEITFRSKTCPEKKALLRIYE